MINEQKRDAALAELQKLLQVENEIKRRRAELERLQPPSLEQLNELIHALLPDLPEDWVLIRRRAYPSRERARRERELKEGKRGL